MKREFIEGMKTLGSIASILLQGALESMAKAQEENFDKEFDKFEIII